MLAFPSIWDAESQNLKQEARKTIKRANQTHQMLIFAIGTCIVKDMYVPLPYCPL